MDGIIDKFIGSYTKSNQRRVKKTVEEIKEKASEYLDKDDSFFARKTEEFKRRLQSGEPKVNIIVDALAVCYAAIHKSFGYDPYDVQLEAAVAMQGEIKNGDYLGNIVAEMKTGEGKTLVQILTAYFNALDGRSVHIVSSNDYLAGRDFEQNRKVFELLGLSVGLVQGTTPLETKKEAYSKNIMFSTVKNIAFDYLRDNTTKKIGNRVMPMEHPFGHIVIDEVDSTLIDEATTPIILSPSEDSEYKVETDEELYLEKVRFLKSLKDENIGVIDVITDEQATRYFEEHPEVVFIYCKGTNKAVYLNDKYNGDEVLMNVIRAEYYFHEGQQYKVADKLDKDGNPVYSEDGKPLKVINIIDGPTGRLSPSKRYKNGIHQAIEAKEKYKAMRTNAGYDIELSDELMALGVCTYADVLSMYEGNVSGMTGTSSEILEGIYGLPTYQVPTRKQNVRTDKTKYYISKKDKYDAIIKDAEECYKVGRPVLIGTLDVNESLEISALLAERGIIHNVLNADSEYIESEIIASAGQFGSVTVATNMAGRGTDIKLGKGVRELGGLRVIGTTRNKSSRIDNQLRGRCSRQGDVGSSTYYSSLEDERVNLFTGKLQSYIKNKLSKIRKDERTLGHPIEDRVIDTDLVDKAQESDEITTEAMIREVITYKNPLIKQRKRVYEFRNEILNSKDISSIILQVLQRALDDITDVESLKEQFGSYINISDSDNLETAKAKVTEEITNRVKGLATNGKYHDIMRKNMLSIVDDYWIVQMQVLENGRFQWLTETIDGTDPVVHYEKRAYELFCDMISYVFEEILAYAYNPNMKYGTYSADRKVEEEQNTFSL